MFLMLFYYFTEKFVSTLILLRRMTVHHDVPDFSWAGAAHIMEGMQEMAI